MTRDTRNAVVVVSLILAMTAGARLLLWLEPQASGANLYPPLVAVDGGPVAVEEVVIEYIGPAHAAGGAAASCLIDPAGECAWAVRGPHLRLVVLGSAGDKLPRVQKNALLTALDSVLRPAAAGRIPVTFVGDPAGGSDLLPQADDLRRLLARKGLLP